jgi:hypothetical protein
MRLILVEHGGEHVCGDSAVFGRRSPEWAENAFQKVGVAQLAVVAARLCDESHGRFRWNYQYSTFGPSKPGGGYDVFVCAEDMDEAPPERFRKMSDLLCCSFYAGFVRCMKPAIAFDINRRSSSAGKRGETIERTGGKRASTR